jgi:EAL domain-containing protein (putative c-di-GMP-specific phosphodiesterase class I)
VLDQAVVPRLVLQPMVELRSGRLVGYEALARFGSRLSTPPTRWFEAAARIRRGPELEALLVEQALAVRVRLPATRFLSINVSPAALDSPDVQRAFAHLPDLTGVVVELTEHAEFDLAGRLKEHLTDLRSRGAQLALDDVGAGWAGLRQLYEVRPDIVKLDQSIVADADRDPVKLALVEMMLGLCTRLDARLLVEGVESPRELDVFARLGVPLAQGWVFGRPTLEPPLIDDRLAARLRVIAGLSLSANRVAESVDVAAPTTALGAPAVLPGPHDGDALVVLDAERRPVSVLLRERGAVWTAPASRALADEATSQALLRALTRPVQTMFVPLVCVDRDGCYIGLIRIDELARKAARDEGAAVVVLPA